MATKVIVIGSEQPKELRPKPIEFRSYFNIDKGLCRATTQPRGYNFIELICRNYYSDKLDLMFAYNDSRDGGVLYLGKFNDGVVE